MDFYYHAKILLCHYKPRNGYLILKIGSIGGVLANLEYDCRFFLPIACIWGKPILPIYFPQIKVKNGQLIFVILSSKKRLNLSGVSGGPYNPAKKRSWCGTRETRLFILYPRVS